MKAILDQDIVLAFTAGQEGTEVGLPPAGVGLERLRWSGQAIIDLATLSTMWVERKNGVFILHAVAVPGSQAVAMSYADRRRLMDDAGAYRLKTDAELQEEAQTATITQLKVRLRKVLDKELGDTPDQLADISKCLVLILTYLAGGVGAADAKAAIDTIAPAFVGIYSVAASQDTLQANAAVLRDRLAEYYQSLPA